MSLGHFLLQFNPSVWCECDFPMKFLVQDKKKKAKYLSSLLNQSWRTKGKRNPLILGVPLELLGIKPVILTNFDSCISSICINICQF
jgi:hypothetical protein